MDRTSSYTIYVDLPGNTEQMLLVHGYTGAYDRVSRRVATYLRSREAGKPPRPLYGDWSPEPQVGGQVPVPTEKTLETLQRRGYLTSMSVEEEREFFKGFATKIHQNELQRSLNYIFMPTYDCNLRCAYCFQDHMRTDLRFQHLLRTMQPEVVDRIFKAMPELEASQGLVSEEPARRSIGFFGGEPLLAQSRPIVEYIMNQARSLGEATFWAVTNGTELEAYRDLLGPQGIAIVQITLDGPPAEHDQRRIYADGSGSFEKIARNVNLALELGTVVNLRMNVDRINIQHLPALAAEICSRGWDRYQTFGASTAPVHAANEKTEIQTTFTSWQLDQAVDELRTKHPEMHVIGRPDEGLKDRARRIFALKSDALPQFKASFCGAHQSMYIFDAFADIYACWERTGDSRVRIGNVREDGALVLNKNNLLWRSRTVTSNSVCLQCRYALHCGGGCAVLAEGVRGDFFANYCDSFSVRFRACVAEAFQDHVTGVEFEARQDRVCDL